MHVLELYVVLEGFPDDIRVPPHILLLRWDNVIWSCEGTCQGSPQTKPLARGHTMVQPNHWNLASIALWG